MRSEWPHQGPFLLQLPWLLDPDPELPLINAGRGRFFIAFLPRHNRDGRRLQRFAHLLRLAEQSLQFTAVVHQVFPPDKRRDQNVDFLCLRPAPPREGREKSLSFLSSLTSLQRRASDRTAPAGRWRSLDSSEPQNSKTGQGHSVKSTAPQESSEEWTERTATASRRSCARPGTTPTSVGAVILQCLTHPGAR